jgi:hypothetical protein
MTNTQEGHFYWTVSEFEELITELGVDFVLPKLNREVRLLMQEWFDSADHRQSKKACALCS